MAPADSYAGLSAVAFGNGLQIVISNSQGLPTTAMHMSIAQEKIKVKVVAVVAVVAGVAVAL